MLSPRPARCRPRRLSDEALCPRARTGAGRPRDGRGFAPRRPTRSGNFSINHLSTVSISDDRVDVRYVLDQAEIPTVQERSLSAAEVLADKRDEVLRGLELTVDGRRVALEADGRGRVSFPTGSGGLKTSRFEFRLLAAVDSPRSRGAARQHVPRPRRLEGHRGRARRGHRRAHPRRPAAIPPTGCGAIPRTCSTARSTGASASFRVESGRWHAGGARATRTGTS